MYICDLFKMVGLPKVEEELNVFLLGLANNSTKVKKGDLFLIVEPLSQKYIDEAVRNGICAVLTYCPVDTWGALEIPVIYLPNFKEYYSKIVYAFFGNPLDKIDLSVAVTGTNGKTTISYLVKSLLEQYHKNVISLGTIEYSLGNEQIKSSLTTPGILELASFLNKGVRKKCTALVMEVSSHALEQSRVDGILYHRSIFTNLTQDHLDYHLNFENYYQAKKRLFEDYLRVDGIGIINYDQYYGKRILREVLKNYMTFSQKNGAKVDVCLKSYQITLTGINFEILYQNKVYFFQSKLIGIIHLENLLAVITLGFSLNFSYQNIFDSIKDIVVPGRLQPFFLTRNKLIVVDYAHTPDALERALKSLRQLNYSRLLCIFGCGGDRDSKKRKIMGEIACRNSDVVFITNDNPRTEDPLKIAKDILQGVCSKNKENVKIYLDRFQCITKVLEDSKENDCILIAGKGHEEYQILKDKTIKFSDIKIVEDYQSLC